MSDTIDSIARTTTVANVVDNIRDRIILQKYKAGTMLAEIPLSKEYDTSRSTIRTSLQILESEGLIATLPNGRKRVVGITTGYVNDLYEVRKLLECEAVRLVIAADHVDYSGLAEAVGMFNDVANASEDVMRTTRAKANSQFHRALFEMSCNRPLLQCWITIEPTIAALAKFNSDTLDPKTHKDDYIFSHTKLLEMIITKDPNVVTYLTDHIEAAKRDTFIGLREVGCI